MGTSFLAGEARADQLAITIGDLVYTPATIEAHAGDTVVWTNKDTGPLGVGGRVHTVVADDGSFVSPDLPTGDSFSHTFPKQGELSYHCRIHPDMKGNVRVLASSQSPGPSPAASPTPAASPSVVVRTIVPSPSPSPSRTPSPSPRPSPQPSPSPTPTPSPSPAPSPSLSASPSGTPAASASSGGGPGTLIVAVAGLAVAAAAGGGLLWLRRHPPGVPPVRGGRP